MNEIKLVYEQIRDYIKSEALSKIPGDALETEVSYSAMFKVSRPTVRKAVDDLVILGIVKRLPGKGLIVGCKEESQNSFNKLAILVPFTPGDGFFYELLMGCISVLNECGYNYSIFNYSDVAMRKTAFKQMRENNYSGVIMTAYHVEDYELMNELKVLGIPFILVDNPVEDSDTPHVISDDYMGGYLATEYLINHGHKKILYLSLDSEIQTIALRLKGHQAALETHQIYLTGDFVVKLSQNEEIYEILAKRQIDYTAICGYSDLPVIMAYNYLMDKNVSMPSEVSLLGYGNLKASELLKLPLSTISIPVHEMGVQAAVMMTEHIKHKANLFRKLLQVSIVERDSVAFCQ